MLTQTNYRIALAQSHSLLSVSLTNLHTNESWENGFDEGFIEALTRKTGNQKTFPVFGKMLFSALNLTSDSVLIDVLSSRDLELLRERKVREPHAANNHGKRGLSTALAANPKIDESKMFLILTYIVEYDKVHYPLSLNKVIELLPECMLDEKSQLVGMIDSLKKEISYLKSHNSKTVLT